MTDHQFLPASELRRLPATINAMSNSAGGIITLEGGREILVEPSDTIQLLDGKAYRRIEGQNVESSAWARSVMASRSGDDFPYDGAVLDASAVDAFREMVLALHDGFRHLKHKEFMRRAGIFSGKHVTFAGALMFGQALNITAKLSHKELHAEIDAHNIWEALTVILPRLSLCLPAKCREELHDAFITSLLNADYNIDAHINITILSSPARIVIDSPRHISRNHRLRKIAALAGITAAPFEPEHDMLNFRAISTILLGGTSPLIL